MNKEIKQKWIDALRSGEYNQAKTYLKNINNYCCLGVLCEVYRKETGKGKWEKTCDNSDVFNFISSNDKNALTLTDDVVEWAGLKCSNPKNPLIKFQNSRTHIAAINDVGVSFNEIADLIEEQL